MEVMTTAVIVRHGECPGNREGLFRGRKDFPLNENGVKQAQALATAISKRWDISAVYSGPLSRAMETARIVAERCDAPFYSDESFNNINLGPWEGRPKVEVEKEFPKEWQTWLLSPEDLRLPGAESLGDVQRRAFEGLEALIRRHRGEPFVVVSHRAVIKPLIAACLKISPPYFWRTHVDTASYSVLVHNGARGYCLTQLNETDHLESFIQEWV